MIDPAHQAFQEIQKLDKFLTKCNMLFEDPYQDEHPSHNEAITARKSLNYVDDYFRQLGYLDIRSKWLREVSDLAEGEDWSRVSRYIKDANNEYMAINRVYQESMKRSGKDDIYSKMADVKPEHTNRSHIDTRLSRIDEAPLHITNQVKYPSPQIIQYIRSRNIDRNEAAILAQSRQEDLPVDDRDLLSHRSDHEYVYGSKRQPQPQPEIQDEDLRSQLRLALDKLSDHEPQESNLKDPESVVTERVENQEELKRRGERASHALYANNPNIADLNDKNRPTKLAERFSNLYDDLWTDAHDELLKHYRRENISGKQATLDLADIVKAVFAFTTTHVQSQQERIAHQTREMMLDPCSDRKQENDTDPFRHDDTFRQYASGCIKSTADLSVPPLQKNFITHAFPKHLNRISQMKSVKQYTDKCVELSWLMSVHNPPMDMVWPDVISARNLKDYFRYFTVTGSVLDHEVWPALLLHKNGPIVVKGVAQFRDV